MNVAIIPARGGSKRIPRKNIRPFCGCPIIHWPVKAALESGCFERVLISTDDDEVATEGVRAGAEAPFRRPAALADDLTPTLPVVAHAIEWLLANGCQPERVCCIYPTAPLIQASDLQQGLDLLTKSGANYVFSGASFPFPPARALRLDAEGYAIPAFPQFINHRSQDLPEMFHDAGQFYWGTAAAFLKQIPIFQPGSRPLMLPRWRVQDIDTLEDWQYAELLYRASKETLK